MKLILALLLALAATASADEYQVVSSGGAAARNHDTGQPNMFRKGDIISTQDPGGFTPKGYGWKRVDQCDGPCAHFDPDSIRGFAPYLPQNQPHPMVADKNPNRPVLRPMLLPMPYVGIPVLVVVMVPQQGHTGPVGAR